jgi:hypothetical protein
MKAGGGLTGWQASRDISHETEDAIVKGLELAVLEWNLAACAPPVFGWWQKPRPVPPSTGCKPTNVSFNFRVSDRGRSLITLCRLPEAGLACYVGM